MNTVHPLIRQADTLKQKPLSGLFGCSEQTPGQAREPEDLQSQRSALMHSKRDLFTVRCACVVRAAAAGPLLREGLQPCASELP